jgi:Predicted membrane protein (DUF2142)
VSPGFGHPIHESATPIPPSTLSRTLNRDNLGVRVALAAGLALLAVTIAVRVSRPPLTAFATNSVKAEGTIANTQGNTTFCQSNETVPAGASAMRVSVGVNVGPKVTVTVLSGSRVIAKGAQAAGWTGEEVTVPIAPVPSAVTGASVCIAIGPTVESIGLIGVKAPHPTGEAPGKVRVEYLRPGNRTWLSMAGAVARRMGLGRSPSGTWIAFVPILLMLAALVLASRLVLRELGASGSTRPPGPPRIAGAAQAARRRAAPVRRPHRPQPERALPESDGLVPRLRAAAGRVPKAAWVCGAVAWLSAASWGIVMAPFQVPDEPAHFAYVQRLAETGGLPTSGSVQYAPEEIVALTNLDHNEVRYNALRGTISTAAQQQRLERYLAQPIPRVGAGGAGVATSQPPLYYALQTIPYGIASGGNLLERLALMKLLSAVMAALTAFFAFLFLREALPAAPWAWTVGALVVALFPLLGFMSGAVNPDSGLAAVSAALFYLLARAFRRGLSPGLGVAIGVVTAVGFLTKLNFLGLVPGLALALVVLTRRAEQSRGRRAAYRSLALSAAIGASPVLLYAVINLFSNHPGLGLASIGLEQSSKQGSVFHEISYIWQLYLPRLPGMANDFPGLSSSRLWFNRSVGLYGWLDTTFPTWVYNVALVPAGAIAALCASGLVASRTALRGRGWELATYAVMSVGLVALVGADSYLGFPARAGGYTEPRYMLPLAVLFGAVFALAARGAGRRWGPVVGTLLVVLIFGHDLFSQLLVVSRYYG